MEYQYDSPGSQPYHQFMSMQPLSPPRSASDDYSPSSPVSYSTSALPPHYQESHLQPLALPSGLWAKKCNLLRPSARLYIRRGAIANNPNPINSFHCSC